MRRIRRFLSFIAGRVLAVTLILGLAIMAFYVAMNTSNIWVLIDEGLDLRSTVVLKKTEGTQLSGYFRDEFLAQDPILTAYQGGVSPYRDYQIRSYHHEVEFLSIWAWPWENIARAEVIERISNLDGSVVQNGSTVADADVPKWPVTRYRVTLVRNSGRWKISNLQILEQT